MEDTFNFSLEIYQPIAPCLPSAVIGNVTDAISRKPVEGAIVTTDAHPFKIIECDTTGYYKMSHEQGNFTMTVGAPCYKTVSRNVMFGGALEIENFTLNALFHSADYNPPDRQISFDELLRVIQLYNSNSYHCDSGTDDSYAPGDGEQVCEPHDSDYAPQDWRIGFDELLRLIQFYNSSGYHLDQNNEDGFAPEK